MWNNCERITIPSGTRLWTSLGVKKRKAEKESSLGIYAVTHVQPDQPWMSQKQARAIRERLLNEIPAEGFLKMPEVPFAYVDRYERELKPGNPLLIK